MKLTDNKRIVLNIAATYGRSLFALVCGIFTGRWVLMSLGHVDYGLFGVVGGLTAFITFFNGVLASAIGRFYAFSVGAAKTATDKEAALIECRAWFNTAVSIHTILPVVLIAVGYPIGSWAIQHFLTIPPERINACVWLFRFVCFSCFIGMVNVPFQAMYTAKQHIAELTIYSFCTTSLNVVFLYVMVTHPGDWLLRYGAWTCCLSVVPQVIICARAIKVFPECKLVPCLMFKISRFKQLGAFACWQIIGIFSCLLRNQGIAILVNKFYGPQVNAAMQVGSTVNGQASSLSGAMTGAFSPAIVTAYGARDLRRMESLVFTMCKFGVLLSMIFVVPLTLELPVVLKLWLKNPPMYAEGFARLFLVLLLLENSTIGHMIAVNASGRIAMYHVCMGSISLLALPIAFCLAYFGGAPYVVTYAVYITVSIYTIARLILARRIVHLPIRPWVFGIMSPAVALFVVAALSGSIPRLFMPASFLRVCVTTVFCEFVFLPLTWFILLSNEERRFVVEKFGPRIKRIFGR